MSRNRINYKGKVSAPEWAIVAISKDEGYKMLDSVFPSRTAAREALCTNKKSGEYEGETARVCKIEVKVVDVD